MNICEHLTATAQLFPHKEAVVFEGQRLTFCQLDRISSQAAEKLLRAGIVPGDRVAIMLPNVPAFIVWYFAALRVGAIAVSVSTRLSTSEVAFLISDCGAKVFVADEPAISSIQSPPVAATIETNETGNSCNGESFSCDDPRESTWVDREPQDPAVILYTSGTTGFAKGATLSHLNVRSNVCAFNHLCNMQADDRILLAVPLFHCFGQNALLNSAFHVGATLVLQRKFDPTESKQLMRDERVSQLYGVPTMFQLFLECCQPADLAAVTYCFSAAAPLPIQISRRWQAQFGQPIYEGYGLTETSPFASYNHRSQYLMGSIGTPIDCVEMKVVDTETGAPAAIGELGEIAIRGPNVMLGYWNRPDETTAAIRNGWFYSGDIGRRDQAGFYYIVDRVKDMISVGGLKVYPAEVERVLLDHEAVSQAAVVGIPDKVFGEQVVAFVTTADGVAASDRMASDIRQHCRGKVAEYKLPKHVGFLDDLPRNPSGKVLKTVLREQYPSRFQLGDRVDGKGTSALPSASSARRKPLLRTALQNTHLANRHRVAMEFVQDAVRQLTAADERPDPETRFLDAGLDSLMIVDLSSQLQMEIGPEQPVPATLVFDYPRVRDLAEFLVQAISPSEAAASILPTGTTHDAGNLAETIRNDTAQCANIESMSEEEVLAELMRELDSK